MATPNRPANVPESARWNETNQQWEQGTYDAAHKRNLGAWTVWRKNGKLWWESTYNDEGQMHGAYKRYHPNGKTAQEGTYNNGKLNGLVTYHRLINGQTDESCPYAYGSVALITRLYHNDEELYTKHYWANGTHCSYAGDALPGNLPTNAYCVDHYSWESGEFNERGRKIGYWEIWSYRGYGEATLKEKINYNSNGLLHGLRTHYSYSGDIEFNGAYENGLPVGEHFIDAYSNKTVGESIENVKHMLVKYDADNQIANIQYFDSKGKPCNRLGKPILNASLSDIWEQCPPEAFLSDYANTAFTRVFGEKKSNTAALDAAKATFQAIYDRPMPEKIAFLLDWAYHINTSNLSWYANTDLAGFQYDVLRLWLDTGKNVFEQAVRKAQVEYPFDFLVEWFSNTIALNKFQTSTYSYYEGGACSFLYAPFSDYVHPLVHSSYNSTDSITIHPPMSSNLSTWLYLITLLSSHRIWAITTFKQTEDALVCLQNKINIKSLDYSFFNYSRHYNTLSRADVSAPLNDSLTELYLERSRWIIEILRAQLSFSSIDIYIFNGSDAYLDFAKMQENMLGDTFELELQHHIPDALYYMWTGYFCKGGEAMLAKCVTACLESPIRIIRDTALLVQEFMNGRTTLGHQREMQTLRHRFEPKTAQA